MLTQVRHRWEKVALSSGASLCATHGSLICGDGEHRYDVTSYRNGAVVYTTFMVYSKDGKCHGSIAHEFVSDRPWGNAEMEKALIRYCESRDGGMRSDGSVREDWGGFIRFVEERTDSDGNDIYGSPVVTALRWMPFDMASHPVKAAIDGDMDSVDIADEDDVTDNAVPVQDNMAEDDRSWDSLRTPSFGREEGWDDDDHIPLQSKGEERLPLEKGQSLDDSLSDIQAQDVESEDADVVRNGWEIWLWHSTDNHNHIVPSLIVYGQRRLTDRDKALALWEDCKHSCLGSPKMLVRISDDKLTQIEDLSAFTISIGTGVGFGGKL